MHLGNDNKWIKKDEKEYYESLGYKEGWINVDKANKKEKKTINNKSKEDKDKTSKK